MESPTRRIVAAKVSRLEAYNYLQSEGFTMGHAVKCPQCDCAYRMFYKPEASIMEQSLLHQPFIEVIEQSHAAGHPNDILERGR